MRMSKRQVASVLSAARLKAAEDRLRERQENRTEEEIKEEHKRIAEQIEKMEKVFNVMYGGNGGDIA